MPICACCRYDEPIASKHKPEGQTLSNRQERISVRSVQHLLGQYGVHPHQLRHTFITGLVRANEDIAVIQSLSGHSSADMILRYSQPSDEDKQQAVELIYKD